MLFTAKNNFIFPDIHVLLEMFIISNIVLLAHKNRTVNSNAFHDNRHVRLSILLVAEKSINHSILFYK